MRFAGALTVVLLASSALGDEPASARIELGGEAAMALGERVAFDGEKEGLAWPALARAVAKKPPAGGPIVLAAPRDVPTVTVLRAAWTLRAFDLRVETPDSRGTTRQIALPPRRETTGNATCRLAAFVTPDGSVRVAAPSGPREFHGERAGERFVRALAAGNAQCPAQYVAFGAEKNDMPWSAVFDLADAVDRAKAAPNARYVLGEPVRVKSKNQAGSPAP
jgi:hypothetical protein